MIKAEYYHEVQRKQAAAPVDDLFRQANYDGLETELQRLFSQRTVLAPRDWETQWLECFECICDQNALEMNTKVLVHIEQWQHAYPESFFPAIVRAKYWHVWLSHYRGQKWAESVTPEMWQCIRAAQLELFAAAIDALHRSEHTWCVALYLMQSIVIADVPDWFNAWYLRGHVPLQLEHHITKPAAALAAQSGLYTKKVVQLSKTVPEFLKQYQRFKSSLQDMPHPEAAFWLKVYLAESGYGFAAAKNYCWFLLPRWGFDHQAILNFSKSDWCEGFSELEKSELNFVIWHDQLDVYFDAEDRYEIEQHIQKAQDILKRPLNPNNRANVLLKLSYFYDLLDSSDPNIQQCLEQATAHGNFSHADINRAIRYWKDYSQHHTFLGKIAQQHRESLASAAILYGFLTEHGFSGVEKHVAVAQSWYEHAYELESPDSFSSNDSCFYQDVTAPFQNKEEIGLVIKVLRAGADLGYCSCNFSVSYWHSVEDASVYDPKAELYYCQRAVEQGHVVAMNNMAIHYFNLAVDEDETQPETYLKEAYQYFERTRKIIQTFNDQHDYSYDYLADDIVQRYCEKYYIFSFDPEITQALITLLTPLAEQRHYAAMCALADLYSDPNRQHSYNYVKAVKWCLAAYYQDSQTEKMQQLFARLHANKKSKQQFEAVERTLSARKIPGRQDVFW
ncbi:DUF4034 domain-containing protein [Acinetobacter sp. MD2(2019)]|uniref:DUF4034 domain-containing protein n=1 Tax=Acinetobacter sp. MD2(2019) TaxID=2605273 RepID=UPI002D1EA66F|nr:DUF4034 domain-containing protein [Acinetobacter sp. MD2(2019)]MEB3753773.1 DUF4034 domain-containing protein [Acinetobacter sp. MD2(2019)]